MERAGRLSTPGPDAHSLLTVLRKTCFQPLFPELTETSGFAPAKPLVPTDCSVFKSQQTPPQDAKSHPLPTTRNQVYPQGYRGFESHPLRQLRNSHHRSVSALRRKLRYDGNFFAFGPDSLRWIPGRERRGTRVMACIFFVNSATSEQAAYRLLRLFSKVGARSFRRSSFPNRTRFAGLRFGFGRGPDRDIEFDRFLQLGNSRRRPASGLFPA